MAKMDARPLDVLLIEDNPGDARLMQRIFAEDRTARVDLICADRLAQGLERLTANHIDAVLLDLTLPDSTGLDTLERVHAHAPSTPIVVLTGLDDEALALEAVRLGAQDYLIKGRVDAQVLSRTLRYAIERQRAEEALRESEERFRDLYENAPNAYFSVGADGNIRRCNRRAGELLGYAREDLIEKPVLDLYADTSQGKEKARQILQRFRSGEAIPGEELEMRRADGTPIWINLSVNPVRDAQGQVLESRSIVVDITARKRAEAALRESEERYQLALHAIDEGIWEWNIAENTAYLSPRWKSMLGYADHEIPNKVGGLEKYVHPDDRQKWSALLQDCLEGRVPHFDIEFEAQRKDGMYRWIQSRASLVRDATGKPLRIVGSHKDITERKRAEVQLAAQLDELRRWYAVTLGRETRILDLKREVNDLLVQAGQPPRYPSAAGDHAQGEAEA